MLHSKHVTIPANTSASSPFRTTFKVNRGVIYRVWLSFPAGCAGLARIAIKHEGHPFLPVHEGDYIRGDGVNFEYPIFYEIESEPQQMTIVAWNLDELYEHTIDVQMLIIDKKYITPGGAGEGIIAAMRSIFVKPEGF